MRKHSDNGRNDYLASLALALIAPDATHVTIARAAAMRGESIASLRQRAAAGEITIEPIPGSGADGVPIAQIFPRWLAMRRGTA